MTILPTKRWLVCTTMWLLTLYSQDTDAVDKATYFFILFYEARLTPKPNGQKKTLPWGRFEPQTTQLAEDCANQYTFMISRHKKGFSAK